MPRGLSRVGGLWGAFPKSLDACVDRWRVSRSFSECSCGKRIQGIETSRPLGRPESAECLYFARRMDGPRAETGTQSFRSLNVRPGIRV